MGPTVPRTWGCRRGEWGAGAAVATPAAQGATMDLLHAPDGDSLGIGATHAANWAVGGLSRAPREAVGHPPPHAPAASSHLRGLRWTLTGLAERAVAGLGQEEGRGVGSKPGWLSKAAGPSHTVGGSVGSHQLPEGGGGEDGCPHVAMHGCW